MLGAAGKITILVVNRAAMFVDFDMIVLRMVYLVFPINGNVVSTSNFFASFVDDVLGVLTGNFLDFSGKPCLLTKIVIRVVLIYFIGGYLFQPFLQDLAGFVVYTRVADDMLGIRAPIAVNDFRCRESRDQVFISRGLFFGQMRGGGGV